MATVRDHGGTAGTVPIGARAAAEAARAIGAMNLFQRDPGSLPGADVALAQALADVATIGILHERAIHRSEVLNERLQTALTTRVIVEQAKGVLAQQGTMSMDVAFSLLRNYSRAHNQRLAEVTRRVIDTDLATEILAAHVDEPSPRSRRRPG
ncbi:MAG: hypothetical protein QOE32_7670 [Pseudonocardiales bacterium]|nr:hypothetical protein [Pseudonocardiales bacterium]